MGRWQTWALRASALPTSAADLGIAAPAADVVPAPATSTTVPVTVPPAPVRLTAGALRGIDHRANGAGALYRLADGTAVVRLEDIDIQNGPDYLV